MRYYDLDKGKVRGSYTVPQPDKELVLLDDPPDDASLWDGMAWVPDQEKISANQAVKAKAQEKAEAAGKIAALADEIPKAASIANLKTIMLELVAQLKIVNT